jgi:hypothetical protein
VVFHSLEKPSLGVMLTAFLETEINQDSDAQHLFRHM